MTSKREWKAKAEALAETRDRVNEAKWAARDAFDEALREHAEAIAERDRARDTAVALENEVARVVHILSTQVIPDADPTSAYLCGVQDGYRTATKAAIDLLTEPTP